MALAAGIGIIVPNMHLRLIRKLGEDKEFIAASSIGTFQAAEPPTLVSGDRISSSYSQNMCIDGIGG